MVDDLRELKELVRELLAIELELTGASKSMDGKLSAVETANERLFEALEELRSFNSKLDRLDTRIEQLEREMHLVRQATDEIKELVPDLGRGPLAKAKNALTGD